MTSYLDGTYNKIPDTVRDKLVELVVIDHMTIKEAAHQLKIKYPTAKTIYKVFKRENRTFKF
jgi:transposase